MQNMFNKKIILLNGPAGAGKDTLASKLIGFGYERCEFKQPLIDIALIVSGCCPYKWQARYDNRILKEEPWDELNGMSQREFLIHISEDWVKPLMGIDHFGKLAAIQALKAIQGDWDVVFSDSGFPEEMDAIIDKFGVDNVILIRLMREGYSFSGDSRDYLEPREGQPCLDIELEEGDPDKAVFEIYKFVEDSVNEKVLSKS